MCLVSWSPFAVCRHHSDVCLLPIIPPPPTPHNLRRIQPYYEALYDVPTERFEKLLSTSVSVWRLAD